MRHLITTLSIVGTILFASGCNKKAPDQRVIFWPNSADYVATSQKMKLNAQQAREILDKVKAEKGAMVYAVSPLFIADDCYVFGVPKKIEIPVTGYYVNGFTGRIEYRESHFAIKAHEENLPDGAFYKITEIAGLSK